MLLPVSLLVDVVSMTVAIIPVILIATLPPPQDRPAGKPKLNGYGVELALKSTEYKAVDDTKVEGGAFSGALFLLRVARCRWIVKGVERRTFDYEVDGSNLNRASPWWAGVIACLDVRLNCRLQWV